MRIMGKSRGSFGLMSVIICLASSQSVAAFGLERNATHWKRGESIEFVINMAHVPSTLSQAQIEAVVRQAMVPWNEVTTAAISLTVSGVVTDPDKTSPQADGVNMIFWESGSTPRGDMVAGKAYPSTSGCDILLQPQAPFTLIDVRAIVMHELGHCLGLAHSTAHSVMTKFQGLPSLGVDDAIAVSLLYPRDSASFDRTRATLKGQITRNNHALVGAVLRVVDPKTQRIVVSGFSGLVNGQRRRDTQGRFELSGLPPGRYILHIEPMDAFAAADPRGYGSPTGAAPNDFQPRVLDLPSLEGGDVHDVGAIDVEGR